MHLHGMKKTQLIIIKNPSILCYRTLIEVPLFNFKMRSMTYFFNKWPFIFWKYLSRFYTMNENFFIVKMWQITLLFGKWNTVYEGQSIETNTKHLTTIFLKKIPSPYFLYEFFKLYPFFIQYNQKQNWVIITLIRLYSLSTYNDFIL